MHGRYYLSDRTSTPNTGRVDVIDANDDTYLYSIGDFGGNLGNFSNSGPNGVLAIPQAQQLWAGDARSGAKVVDLRAGAAGAPSPSTPAAPVGPTSLRMIRLITSS